MDSLPIFRELRLVISDKEDVQFFVDILCGKSTVSHVADLKGQESYCFDADADIVVFSYTTDLTGLKQDRAAKLIGEAGNAHLQKMIIPALYESNVPLEICFKYCNLSTESVILLSDAIRDNRSLVGFNVSGNPGNDEIGEVALKHACIETMAPIQWFQGEFLPDFILEARQDMARKHALDALHNESMSPKSKVAELRKIQLIAPDSGVEVLDLHTRLSNKVNNKKAIPECSSSTNKDKPISNEREIWYSEQREKLMASGMYKEQDLDTVLANLELYELQMKLEMLIFIGDNKQKTSPLSSSKKRTSLPQMI